MNETRLRGRLLIRLFRDGQAGEITDIIGLSRACESDVLALLRALRWLERAGLADARRLRLTLSGLALAAALASRAGQASPAVKAPPKAPRRERRPGQGLASVHRLPRPAAPADREGVVGLVLAGR